MKIQVSAIFNELRLKCGASVDSRNTIGKSVFKKSADIV